MPGSPIYEADPRGYSRASAGSIFSATTATTGVAPGTAIGTTAPFTLQNPLGSGIDLVVLRARMGYVSGTLGSGQSYLVVNPPTTAAASGTGITPVNHKPGGASALARAYTTATIASPTILVPFVVLTPLLASSVLNPWLADMEIEGGIVIPPGANLSIESVAAAGTSPLVIYSMTWIERAAE